MRTFSHAPFGICFISTVFAVMVMMMMLIRQSSGFATRPNIRSLVTETHHRRLFSVATSSSSDSSIVESDDGQIKNSRSHSAPSHWEKLGSPTFVMAPMVAQSDLPFRRLCREYGTDLCFTQMIHASNFCESTQFQDSHLDIYHPGEKVS